MELPNIEFLTETDGQITIGNMHPVGYVAVANDQDQTLAMLKRRPDESLMDLLQRLDQAIEKAVEDEIYTDEVNT
jgi:hypothetical protein